MARHRMCSSYHLKFLWMFFWGVFGVFFGFFFGGGGGGEGDRVTNDWCKNNNYFGL